MIPQDRVPLRPTLFSHRSPAAHSLPFGAYLASTAARRLPRLMRRDATCEQNVSLLRLTMGIPLFPFVSLLKKRHTASPAPLAAIALRSRALSLCAHGLAPQFQAVPPACSPGATHWGGRCPRNREKLQKRLLRAASNNREKAKHINNCCRANNKFSRAAGKTENQKLSDQCSNGIGTSVPFAVPPLRVPSRAAA